jgi:hypothetical protein
MKLRLLKISIAIAALIFASELVSIAWYWHSRREFFYTRKINAEIISEESSPEQLPVLRFHPFLGFVDRTNLNVVNSQGFYSAHDFPYSRKQVNEYIIAITGGSVAARIELTGAKNRLIKELRRSSYFRDRPITVINFAMGAYKQPQQLITLAYFLSLGQQIDLVVNIDGFNEAALSSQNYDQSVDIFMPSADIMRPLLAFTNQASLSPENLQILANIGQYKTRLSQIRALQNEAHLATKYFILEVREKLLRKKYYEEIKSLTASKYNPVATSIIYLQPEKIRMSDEILFKEISRQWASSLLLMKALLDSKQIQFFAFLQPNQYFSNKSFTAEERKIAFVPNGTSARGVQKGYPFLLAEIDGLRKQGVHIISAVSVFDDMKETLFIDDCCHFNEMGHDILSAFIAQTILASGMFDGKPKSSSP